MSRMRILITGAKSLLGNQLRQKLTSYDLIASSMLASPDYIQLDTTDAKAVHKTIDQLTPHVVIHLAAQSDIDYCQSHPQVAYKVNVQGTTNLVGAIKQTNPKIHLIFLSSSMVFGGQHGPYTETDSPHPLNVYGQTKANAEKLIQASKLPFTIIRSSTMFGIPPKEARDNDLTRYMKALSQNKTLQLVNDRFYNPISASFVANIVAQVISSKYTGILHVGGSTRLTRYQFVQKLARSLNMQKSPPIIPVLSTSFPKLAPRPVDCTLKTDLLTSIFNLTTPYLESEFRNLAPQLHLVLKKSLSS